MMIKFACTNLEQMFNLVISCLGVMPDITTLDMTCVAAPAIRLVLSEPFNPFEYNVMAMFIVM